MPDRGRPPTPPLPEADDLALTQEGIVAWPCPAGGEIALIEQLRARGVVEFVGVVFDEPTSLVLVRAGW